MNQEKLNQLVEKANGKNFYKVPTVPVALILFKEIKKMETKTNELAEAKKDLEEIFGLDKKEISKMTKNQLYMKHQSLMVNGIYELLLTKEIEG